MKEYMMLNKDIISKFLDHYLTERLKQYCNVNQSMCDVITRIREFSLNGKMIRGCLVILGYNLFHNEINKDFSQEDLVKVAAAVEILHSSLLIHDDIMDNDDFRRGKESMHRQYFDIAKKEKMNDKDNFGTSMAISAGDIGFFLSIELLSEVNDFNKSMMAYFSKEVVGVGMAQMMDVYFTHVNKNPPESDIIEMYKHKTARYTFSMPLALGSILAGAEYEELSLIETIGEKLGIIFQIKDDELGLFGNEKILGKPIFSDIKEGKKTIYNIALMNALNDNEKKYFERIFGSHILSINNVEKIKNMFEQSGVKEKIHNLMKQYSDDAEKDINSLRVNETYKKILLELLGYSLKREK